MRIRLAILEKDVMYLSRLASTLSSKYADKLEIYSYTDMDFAMEQIKSVHKIDILVASDAFDVDTSLLPQRCGFAYLVDSIYETREEGAIYRYQRVDLIYKQILSIYSEMVANVLQDRQEGDSAKVIIFSSPSGGVGTSTMAVACALSIARAKKKTLYLNLENFGGADLYFSDEGMLDMSDIIYALKRRKTNLALKIESSTRRDKSGVYFLSEAKTPLDMEELGHEDIVLLISQLQVEYDFIIIDMDYSRWKESADIFSLSHALVWVTDDSEISNHKTQRAYDALRIVEESAKISVTDRLRLIHNKSSNKSSGEEIKISSSGKVGMYKHMTTRQIASQIASTKVFDGIV